MLNLVIAEAVNTTLGNLIVVTLSFIDSNGAIKEIRVGCRSRHSKKT